MSGTEKLRFGQFEFDFVGQRLAGAAGEIPLNPKSAAVLAYLIQRPGTIVPKDELLRAVWQDTAVTDDALVQRILDVRKALGDNSKTPRYIRTHTKRGYEFVGTIEETAAPAAAPPRRAWWKWSLAAAVLVACAAALWWAVKEGRAPARTGETRVAQLTFVPGMEDHPVFDSSGNRILYTSDEGGKPELWILDLQSGERRAILRDPTGLTEPDWAAGSEWIAYRSEGATGGLFARSLVTGEAIRIAVTGHYPRWSPDGTRVAFQTSGPRGEILVWTRAGGSVRQVEIRSPELSNCSHPAWSADGRFLYLIATPKFSTAAPDSRAARDWVQLGHQVWRIPVDGGEAKLVTPGTGVLRDGGLEFDAPRSQLIFVGLDRSLWRSTIDPASGEEKSKPVRLTLTTQAHQHPRVNARGDVAFSTLTAPESLWLIPFTKDGRLDDGHMERLTTAAASARAPALSPGRRRIAYFIWQGERFELWMVDLKTREVRALGPMDGLSRVTPAWSEDGQWLSYSILGERSRGLRIARFTPDFSRLTGERPALTAAGEPPRNAPGNGFRVAADGTVQTAATSSTTDPTGRYRVAIEAEDRLQSLWATGPDGLRTRIAPPGHYLLPTWSADGHRILFQSDRDAWFNLWAVRFDPERGRSAGEAEQLSFFRGSPYLLSDNNTGYAEVDRGIVVPLRENRTDLWLIRGNPDRTR